MDLVGNVEDEKFRVEDEKVEIREFELSVAWIVMILGMPFVSFDVEFHRHI